MEVKMNEFGEYEFEIKDRKLKELSDSCVLEKTINTLVEFKKYGLFSKKYLKENLKNMRDWKFFWKWASNEFTGHALNRCSHIMFANLVKNKENWIGVWDNINEILRFLKIEGEQEIGNDYIKIGENYIYIFLKINENGEVVPQLTISKIFW